MSFSKDNHYVPVWYQKKFISEGQDKLLFFDLAPTPKHPSKQRRPLKKAPKSCFFMEHLYTTYFSGKELDTVERLFFGKIDSQGAESFPIFVSSEEPHFSEKYFIGFVNFINALKIRTPRALRLYKGYFSLPADSRILKNLVITHMQNMRQVNTTIWLESAWEIVSAAETTIKFIISDNPVTLYNPRVFPKSPSVNKFRLFGIDKIGTRTIVPLDLNHCLILTNRQYLESSNINPLKTRINPRRHGETMFWRNSIIRGRKLTAEQVSDINYIIKANADRYIAAGDEKWLYPERTVKRASYNTFDKTLIPNKDDALRMTAITSMYYGNDTWVKGRDPYGQKISQEIVEKRYAEFMKIINSLKK